jgi:EF hand domain-containing protein
MTFRNLWLAAVVSALSLPAVVGAQSSGDKARPPAASIDADTFNRMDTDEDGFISRDEAKGTSLENRFVLLDLDHDGQLSPSEVDAGSAAQEN